jgi:NAD+ synthase (glutamine-hydrolysing)
MAQLNCHAGNINYNKSIICSAIRRAKDQGADLVAFPELSVTGYPPLGLLHSDDFIEQCSRALIEIAAECSGITAIVGAPEAVWKKLYNTAYVLSEGKIVFTARKAMLQANDIFNEYKYFEQGGNYSVFHFKGKKIALTAGDDLLDVSMFQKPDMIINLAAIPFSCTQAASRTDIFSVRVRAYGVPTVVVNYAGASAELIFDGSSVAIAPDGTVCKKLPPFEEAMLTFDTDELAAGTAACADSNVNHTGLMHDALILGIKDYFRKTGFSEAILGLSGGIDSAVVLCLAAEALGAASVRSLLMPSRYSSAHSIDDSTKLSERLGTRYNIINIEKSFCTIEEGLAPLFTGKAEDATEENIQARIRAVFLMAVSNKSGCMLLNTSNKSEAAVGYGTLYGDMAGSLSVIGDVYKTDVYKLAAYINRDREIIPANIIGKPPSAELRPNQLDSDSLPAYNLLDSILCRYIEQQMPVEEIVRHTGNRETVYRLVKMICSTEYKRYQSPPVLMVSAKASGAGRRIPLAAKLPVAYQKTGRPF